MTAFSGKYLNIVSIEKYRFTFISSFGDYFIVLFLNNSELVDDGPQPMKFAFESYYLVIGLLKHCAFDMDFFFETLHFRVDLAV